MNVRWYVGAIALAVGFTAAPVGAQERLVHQEVDRNTNAIVRVFKTSDGGRIEVETPRLRLTKSVAGPRVVTRMAHAGDELVVTMDEKTVTVAGKAGRLSSSRIDREKLEKARAVVASSTAARAAAELIGKMGFGSATPIQPMLITTRIFILAASGETGWSGEFRRWAREARVVATPAVRALRVNLVVPAQDKDGASKGRTPTECWNEYAKEAIAAYTEYEDCMNDQAWWNLVGQAGCATVYDMRAIGAFSWWLKCVALS